MLTQRHELRYHWVKGHADNPKNNRCDELAVAEWKKFKYILLGRTKALPSPILLLYPDQGSRGVRRWNRFVGGVMTEALRCKKEKNDVFIHW